MSEYTIDIETVTGTATTEEILERVTEEIEASAARDPAVSINTQTGVVAATFQIEAESINEAVKQAVELYRAALTAADVAIGGGRMMISEDDVGSLTVSPAHERELAGF